MAGKLAIASVLVAFVTLALAQAPPDPKKPDPPPAPPAPGPLAIELPAETKARCDGWTVICAKTKGKKVLWQPVDDIAGKLAILPSALLADPNQLVVTPTELGWKTKAQYRFLAMTSDGGELASGFTALSVEPSGPPAPPPVPDTFKPALKAAFDADPLPAAQRKHVVITLAGVYEAAEEFAKDRKLATHADLFAQMQAIRKTMVPDTAVMGIRSAIGAEQVKRFGADQTTKLDDANRPALGDFFRTVSTALMEVAK